jgi:hypothetical protein
MRRGSSFFELRNHVHTLLLSKDEEDWIYNLNIGNVMHLQPINLDEMALHLDNTHELSRDALLEKIILLTVGYFCVGTELRFLNYSISEDELKRYSPDRRREVENEQKK